mmetsp:Transcript_24577/g.74930  ORF Transcript_24577/g.74930 Transcript_24577/m.74930 type:complete len:83 (+) Transcript_24577:870-1118(+)
MRVERPSSLIAKGSYAEPLGLAAFSVAMLVVPVLVVSVFVVSVLVRLVGTTFSAAAVGGPASMVMAMALCGLVRSLLGVPVF